MHITTDNDSCTTSQKKEFKQVLIPVSTHTKEPQCVILDEVLEQTNTSPTLSEGKTNVSEFLNLEAAPETLHKKSGFFGTSFNFINSILGVGIVGIPFALMEAGLVTGLVLLVVMAIITDWSISLLIRTSQLCGAKSYPELCMKAFGISGKVISAFFMWFLTFFGGIGYTIIVGDTVPAVMEAILGFPDLSGAASGSHITNWIYKLLVNRTFWIMVTILFIMLPLSLLDNISKLESFSFLSIVAEVILLGVVLAEAIIILIRVSSGKPLPGDVTGWPKGSQVFIHRNVFGAIGVFSMAYITRWYFVLFVYAFVLKNDNISDSTSSSSDHNSHMLYDAMKDASPSRFKRATHVSVLFSAFIMCFIGLIGYLSFQHNTAGNILNNINIKSVQGNIARAAIAVTMFFTVPLEMFVCRNAASDILTSTIFRNWTTSQLPMIAGRFQLKKIHLIRVLVIILMSIITLVAILVTNLGSILELTGGFSAVMLAYILPSLCHLKLAEGKLFSKEKAPTLLLSIVGIFCFVSGTGFNLYTIITRYQKGEV